MKSAFKSITNSVIVLSVLAILLGILLIVYPGATLVTFGIFVAAFLIVQGLTLVIVDIRAWRLYLPFDGLLPGILSILAGVLLAMQPENIAVYVGVVVGMWIVVSGISGIKLGYALRYTGAPWFLIILMNIIDIVLGALMIFSPIAASLGMTVALGILLIYHAVNCIVNMIIIRKNAKQAEKLIQDKFSLFGGKDSAE